MTKDKIEEELKAFGFKPFSDEEIEQQKKNFEAIGVYFNPLFKALSNWPKESAKKNKGVVLD